MFDSLGEREGGRETSISKEIVQQTNKKNYTIHYILNKPSGMLSFSATDVAQNKLSANATNNSISRETNGSKALPPIVLKRVSTMRSTT